MRSLPSNRRAIRQVRPEPRQFLNPSSAFSGPFRSAGGALKSPESTKSRRMCGSTRPRACVRQKWRSRFKSFQTPKGYHPSSRPSHSASCIVLRWRAVATVNRVEEAGSLAVCRRGGPLRPSRARLQLPKRRQRLFVFATLVRQNNQNSQNEPGMSFGINET